MQAFEIQNTAQEEWCLGWKLTGTRPLTAAELDDLQRESNRLRRAIWGFGCGCPILFFAPFFIFAILYDMGRSNPAAAEWAAAGLLIALLPSAWTMLRANDANNQNRGRPDDLRAGIVKRFAGSPENSEQPDLLANQDANSSLNESPWIEVLPHSQQIFSINGTRPKKWIAAPIALLASMPENASSAAYWHGAGGGDDVTLRSLSHAEKEEVLKHSRTIWRRPFVGAIIFDVWIGLPVVLHWTTGAPIRMEPMAYFLIAMALWSNWTLWRSFALSRNLVRDGESGQAALFRPPLKQENLTADAPSELRAALWEVLPHSGMIWTADGRPSAWRKAKM